MNEFQYLQELVEKQTEQIRLLTHETEELRGRLGMAMEQLEQMNKLLPCWCSFDEEFNHHKCRICKSLGR